MIEPKKYQARTIVRVFRSFISGQTIFRMKIKFVVAASMLLLSVAASAQVIDRIEFQPEANGEKEIVIRFVTDVLLTRFSPESEGNTVRLYILIIGNQTPIINMPREYLIAPRSKVLPPFSVSFPEPDASLSISFASSVSFRVRQIRGSRTLSIFVKTSQTEGKRNPGERNLQNASRPNEELGNDAAVVSDDERRFRRFSAVEPKPVPGIPDVLPDVGSAPTDTNQAQKTASQVVQQPQTVAVPESGSKPKIAAVDTTPKLRNQFEPKPVPGIPDVLPNAGSVPTDTSQTQKTASQVMQQPHMVAVPELGTSKKLPATPDASVELPAAANDVAKVESSSISGALPSTAPVNQVPKADAAVSSSDQNLPVTEAPQSQLRVSPAELPLPMVQAPLISAESPVSPTANSELSSQPQPLPQDGPKRTFATLEEAAAEARAESAAIAPAGDDSEPVPLSQVEDKAKELIDRAKKALAANDTAGAIKALNHLLNLPTNSSTREAQKLIGEAREKSRELVMARSEYELFIRLYPEGPDSDQVRERLAKLPVMLEQQAIAGSQVDAQGKPLEPAWTITGSFSQYHYSGNSHIEILTPPPPGLLTFNQQTLSMTDQNSTISNLDLMARLRSGTTDTRIVIRDSYTQNALQAQSDPNRLSAGYVEQTDQARGYQFRVGRQSGAYGSIGMFDGGFGSYQISPDYRISATAGDINQFGASPIKRSFVGGAVEKIAKLGQIGGTLYFVRQTADGYLDREAVGVEARYFDAHKSAFSMVDYDLSFKRINLIMLQGNYRTDGGTNFYMLSDNRRSPILQLTNVLQAATSAPPSFMPANNVAQALLNTGLSVEDLKRWANDVTATSHLFSAGATYPVNPQWQVGADFGVTSLSSMAGAGTVPAQPGSGISTTHNYQIIGNMLFFQDNAVFTTTQIDAPSYSGRNYNFNYGVSWFDNKLRTDFGLTHYQQWDKAGAGTMNRDSPTFRFSYYIWPTVTLEAETGSEKTSQMDSFGTSVDSRRKYFYMGYRWILQ